MPRSYCPPSAEALALVLAATVAVYLVCKHPGKLPIVQTEGLTQKQAEVQAERAVQHSRESEELLAKLKAAVVPLRPDKLARLQFREGETTKIDDKTIVYLCLRDPETDQYYKWNDLIYVTLHECAHAVSTGFDPKHETPEFQNNFYGLLRSAEAAGIYKPGESFVSEYCGLPMDSSDPGIMMR